jgi:hypothetical protein
MGVTSTDAKPPSSFLFLLLLFHIDDANDDDDDDGGGSAEEERAADTSELTVEEFEFVVRLGSPVVASKSLAMA